MGVIVDKNDLKRKALFVPCETKDALANWIRLYLGLYLPDCTVSDESNSNPMDMVWEAYNQIRLNKDPTYSRVMSYANRGGFKTLGASILEVLVLLHLGRNIAHMAAIENQSKKAAEYVKDFLNRPFIRDYVVGDNARSVKIVRYQHLKNGVNINDDQWKKFGELEKLQYKRIENYIKIVICNMAGANGDHVEFFVVDEVDVIPKGQIRAYEQAKAIPDSRDGFMPVTLLTSTRKSRIGLVQKEIDEASETGLQIRHWNIIDTTAACAPERHKPELPKVNLYINDDLVKHISEADFELLDKKQKEKYYKVEGFGGCVKCPLFAACKSRLATHQKSKSPMLKPIEDVISKFKAATTPEYINTEFLCRKADATGLIYPRFNKEIHMKSPQEIAEMVSGESVPYVTDKSSLINFMKSRGVKFVSGMDFGFTHKFATVTFGAFGHYAFVVDVIADTDLELDDKIEKCQPLKTIFNPVIYGDEAAPDDIKTFKRKGFKMKDWGKAAFKDSVKTGIEIVRMMLWPSSGLPRLFFLKDDPQIDYLIWELENYHFKVDAAGVVTEEPVKENDDAVDALRYGIMNYFAPNGNLKLPPQPQAAPQPTIVNPAMQHSNWMRQIIRQHTGEEQAPTQQSGEVVKIKKGKFSFEM